VAGLDKVWGRKKENMTKAIALVSGGLDSILAAKVIMEEGIEVKGICFVMSFASKDIDAFQRNVQTCAAQIDLDVEMVDIAEEFLEMLQNPEHGYGSNINPCIDCKILMLRKAKAMMASEKASFIVTGEVLGERPMSQNRGSLDRIEVKSGLEGYLLRPLSAKRMEETIPEKEGLVERDHLLSFSGRSRKPQFELAKKYGITKYATPAGGCLLTDPRFSERLADLMKYEEVTIEKIGLLKVGRHFRVDDKTKVIVGRDESENFNIEKLATDEVLLFKLDEEVPGPTVMLVGDISKETIGIAASFCAGHTKLRNDPSVNVFYWKPGEETKADITVKPAGREEIEGARL
jgi:tRNA-uridine 2-sulfurtransferase